MNSDEVHRYRSFERRMVDWRVRFIIPAQVEVNVEIKMRVNADKDHN